MTRKFFIGALILLMSAMIFSAADAKSQARWRLDGSASAQMPRSFRVIDDLRASASAQPSLAAFKTVFDTIHELDPDAKFFMVDLRQETHGFANGLPVSLHVKHNAINAGKTSAEVQQIERDELNNLRGVETTFIPMGKADTQTLKPLTIIPRVTLTERDAAERAGFSYVRFAAADMQFPAPDVVDDFISFVAALPDNAWLHFHCQAGHGRTTTFLVMYELLRNPDAELEEICLRQKNLGGSDILATSDGKDWNARMTNDRAKKIRLFSEYVKSTRAEQIGLPWSEWLTGIER